MKSLYEYIINEKYTDISDWTNEDKIIIARSFTSDNLVGYHMLTSNGKLSYELMDDVEAKLSKEYPNNPEGDDYRYAAHAVLNVVAHQLVDGMSYRDAVKLETERIKSDSYMTKDIKDFVIGVINDDAGKDTKNYSVHVADRYSGYGSRKDMERRLKKIKADSKNLHKYLGHGF